MSKDSKPDIKASPETATPSPATTIIVRESESITDIDEKELRPQSLPAEKDAFRKECVRLSTSWDKSATRHEWIYRFGIGLSGLSSAIIACFASGIESLIWVKIVAFIGALATSSGAYFHKTASQTRNAHRILSFAHLRYGLGKIDTNALLDAYERANTERDPLWLPTKKDS